MFFLQNQLPKKENEQTNTLAKKQNMDIRFNNHPIKV